jgi:hypothetical protein
MNTNPAQYQSNPEIRRQIAARREIDRFFKPEWWPEGKEWTPEIFDAEEKLIEDWLNPVTRKKLTLRQKNNAKKAIRIREVLAPVSLAPVAPVAPVAPTAPVASTAPTAPVAPTTTTTTPVEANTPVEPTAPVEPKETLTHEERMKRFLKEEKEVEEPVESDFMYTDEELKSVMIDVDETIDGQTTTTPKTAKEELDTIEADLKIYKKLLACVVKGGSK